MYKKVVTVFVTCNFSLVSLCQAVGMSMMWGPGEASTAASTCHWRMAFLMPSFSPSSSGEMCWFFFFDANSRRQEPHQYFVTNSLEIKLCTRLNDWKICAGHIPGILRHGCSKEAVFMVLSALSYGHSTVLWLMGHLAVYNRAAFTAGNWHIHFIWKYWKLF